jgi:hypothetical protein
LKVFELSRSRTNDWIHRLLPILKDALDDWGVLPERDPRHFARHEKQQGSSPDYLIDGTERRQRPKDPEKQALHYSGKKKVHSDKNIVIVHTHSKHVGYLSQTYAGKTHDKKVADAGPVVYPCGSKLGRDTGFQGYEPRRCQTYQPKKSAQERVDRR